MNTATKTSEGVPVKFTTAARNKANKLMSNYAEVLKDREALYATIAEELSGHDKKLSDLKASLIEMGETFKQFFDEKDRLELEDGYLLISRSTTVQEGRKFDLAEFQQQRPDMVDIKLKTAPIKKAFLDAQLRKELIALGVSVTTEESIQVKMHKATE